MCEDLDLTYRPDKDLTTYDPPVDGLDRRGMFQRPWNTVLSRYNPNVDGQSVIGDWRTALDQDTPGLSQYPGIDETGL